MWPACEKACRSFTGEMIWYVRWRGEKRISNAHPPPLKINWAVFSHFVFFEKLNTVICLLKAGRGMGEGQGRDRGLRGINYYV